MMEFMKKTYCYRRRCNNPEKACISYEHLECCEGATIDFVAEKQNDVEYLWSFDDGNYSKNENPSHLFDKCQEVTRLV